MTQVLRGNIVHAPKMGELSILEHGCLVLEDGVIQAVCSDLPRELEGAELRDYGDRLLMQSFVDMHLHAPQYPMLGMGMDLQLLDWLNTYTFPTEARFADTDYARRVYRRLAGDLITSGTTRVCMFSSLHTEATWILMDELERAGVTGYVGKVNMDRNGLPGVLEETTEESIRETVRWLDGCHFEHVRPIITPRFTPSCTDELMAALGKLARERELYVQSHLSENTREIDWVRELHPDCKQYWETYDKYGLWKDHTVMAHCVHSDQRERAAIRDAGVVVVHCADSNVNICSGLCPVRQMVNEGLWVTLGSDIAGGAQLPFQCFRHLCAFQARCLAAGHQHQVVPAHVRRQHLVQRGPQNAARAVARYGVAYFFACGDAHARAAQTIFVHIQHHMRVHERFSARVCARELIVACQGMITHG